MWPRVQKKKTKESAKYLRRSSTNTLEVALFIDGFFELLPFFILSSSPPVKCTSTRYQVRERVR